MRVVFKPTTVGTKNAFLQIPVSNNGATAVIAQVSLTGAATQGTLTADPGSINFPDQLVNTISGTTTVTVTNTSGQVTYTPSITLSDGTNFAIVDDGCTYTNLDPNGGTCTFGVQFRPTVAGLDTATVSIVRTNAPSLQRAVERSRPQ